MNRYALESVPYRVTTYDAEGNILDVSSGYISVLLPKQTLAIAETTYLPENAKASQVIVQIAQRGNYEESEALPAFTSENTNFQAGSFSSKITGTIINPYAKDITNLRVYAIAYDAAGGIIGGGFTFIDFVPATGKAAADVSVTVAGTPASVELYATLSGLSEFK
jgi:hypothetical protein